MDFVTRCKKEFETRSRFEFLGQVQSHKQALCKGAAPNVPIIFNSLANEGRAFSLLSDSVSQKGLLAKNSRFFSHEKDGAFMQTGSNKTVRSMRSLWLLRC
jgi:hypothetical protein